MSNKKIIIGAVLNGILSFSICVGLNEKINFSVDRKSFDYLPPLISQTFLKLKNTFPDYKWSLGFKSLCQDIQEKEEVELNRLSVSIIDECLTFLGQYQGTTSFDSLLSAIAEYKKELIAQQVAIEGDQALDENFNSEETVRSCKIKKFCKICARFLSISDGLTVDGITRLNGPLLVNSAATVNGPLVVNGDELINGSLTLTGTLRALAALINGVAINDPGINSEIDALNKELGRQAALIGAGFAGTFTSLADIRQEETTIESTIDICCSALNNRLDDLSQVIITDFSGTFTSLAWVYQEELIIENKLDNLSQMVGIDFNGTFTSFDRIYQEEIIIESKIDSCCGILNSKVDSLSQVLVNDFAATFTAIAALQSNFSAGGCESIPIATATSITSPGTYCITQPINGNITIPASYVTLDLNSFPINGSVISTGSNITVKNGTIQAATPAVNNSGNNVVLENLVIQAANGVDGAAGSGTVGGNGSDSIAINNSGNNCTITLCNIYSGAGGSGGLGGRSVNGAGLSGGNGGNAFAIFNTGSNLMALKNRIISGRGGAGGNGAQGITLTVGVQPGGNGGTGGNSHAVYLSSGSNIHISHCFIQSTSGGNGGSGGAGGNTEVGVQVAYGRGGSGNTGGFATGIYIDSGDTIEIINSDIIGGPSGNGGSGNSGAPGGNGGDGGSLSNGIYHNIPIRTLIQECNIQAGNGGSGGGGGSVPSDSDISANGGNGGNGGAGGHGIYLLSGSLYKIIGCLINKTGIGGSGGGGGSGAAGGSSGSNGTSGVGGDGINNTVLNPSLQATNGVIRNCTISNIARYAIYDLTAPGATAIYTNLALDFLIGAPFYVISPENAIDQPNGTEFWSGGTNVLQNFYQIA